MSSQPNKKSPLKQGISDILLSPKAGIIDALRAMESEPKGNRPAGISIAVDSERHILGVITDGDVRNAILAGISLDQPIERIMTRDPITIREDQIEIGSYSEVIEHVRKSRRMQDLAVGKIIVVDSENRVVDIIALFELLKRRDVKSQTICIVGLGYVGLTLAIALAESGMRIYGIEADSYVREALQDGNIHFHEVGLERSFRSHLSSRLFIGGHPGEAKAGIYIICVGTPIDNEHKPIISDVKTATESVADVLKQGDLVVLRSTVPIGTTRNVVLPILEQQGGLKAGRDFDFVYAPERTISGMALHELRVLPQVIGSLNKSGLERATTLFREMTPFIITVDSLEEAEAVKLLNNAFRDYIFAFANEAALICHRWGLDDNRVISAANEGYPRDSIPLPSPGVGGTCLYKDPYMLVASSRSVEYEPIIIGKSRQINEYMPKYIFDRVRQFQQSQGKSLLNSKLFVVGFAFKGEPETSDMRDSSTLQFVEVAQTEVEAIYGYDPVVQSGKLAEIQGVHSCSVQEGFAGADCVLIMNNHRSYLEWDIYDLLSTMKRPALFLDGWQMFEPSDICKVEGITYGNLSAEYVGDSPINQTGLRVNRSVEEMNDH